MPDWFDNSGACLSSTRPSSLATCGSPGNWRFFIAITSPTCRRRSRGSSFTFFCPLRSPSRVCGCFWANRAAGGKHRTIKSGPLPVTEFSLPFVRFIPLAASIAASLLAIPGLPAVWAWTLLVVGTILSCVGLYDLRQPLHSVRRNYPIVGRLRWFFEDIRPGIRQYLFEDDHEQTPFSRSQRSLVYARAKNEVSDRAFGTLVDVYENGYEFIAHSTRPVPVADPASFRIPIGGDACRQPYSASIFNISAMSFGALSANAIRALNKGAKLGGFAHDTGEGSISAYHREHGGDLIWEIGSGYFGCRDDNGAFDPGRFADQASDPQVRMIELKISQGAKPGKGGILPAEKVT
ncbi:MAG: glutamate synthase-related protein, partial [Sphingopyxis sp.]|nr:glutamate synthase-related protein [Sphingopyxis sp.]